MEHAEKVRRLEELRQLRRLGGMVIYPVANQQGCALAPFAFAQIPEQVALQTVTQDFDHQERGQSSRAA
jgi:hypothetical protein